MTRRNDGTLDRRAVVAALLRDPGDLLVVTGLGAATYDAGAAGDRALNFYLWGAMGGAAMIGLGLALAQPRRRVLVLTGDGDMLMGLGSLATIAAARRAQPGDRRARQRALRRDRRAAQPHRPRPPTSPRSPPPAAGPPPPPPATWRRSRRCGLGCAASRCSP